MQSLEFGNYYHIYNRGINGESLFLNSDNYEYFLRLFGKHIHPIAEIFAWCLMRNHFHFLVKIREMSQISTEIKDSERFIFQQFSNFFNAYSKSFNNREKRHGALFERPFRRKLIEEENYLTQLILYIHTNPVHHNIVNHPSKYHWSSYSSIISEKPTKIYRDDILRYFGGKENFIFAHQHKVDALTIENWY